jgi:hypothetical protein
MHHISAAMTAGYQNNIGMTSLPLSENSDPRIRVPGDHDGVIGMSKTSHDLTGSPGLIVVTAAGVSFSMPTNEFLAALVRINSSSFACILNCRDFANSESRTP